MPNQSINQVISYIKTQRAQQTADEEIKTDLVSAGWAEADIRAAFLNIDKGMPLPDSANSNQQMGAQVPSNSKQKQKNETMWIAFQNILMFISLYASATALHNLWGLAITNYFGKVLPSYVQNSNNNYNYANATAGLDATMTNWALSAIIVAFPLFVLFFISTYRYYQENPAMKQTGSKKFLNYFTLVITFLIMLFTIVNLVSSIIGGGLATNVLLNIISTITISGSIFAYFLYEAKVEQSSLSANTIYAGLGLLSLIILLSVGQGFYLKDIFQDKADNYRIEMRQMLDS